MIAEVKLIISTDATPGEISAMLPGIVREGLAGTDEVIARVMDVKMSWGDWAEEVIDRERLHEQQAAELVDEEMMA